MKDVMVALGSNVENFTAFEIGAIHFMESKSVDANPYEPGLTEYDQFIEGWASARDNEIAHRSPTLPARYQAFLPHK